VKKIKQSGLSHQMQLPVQRQQQTQQPKMKPIVAPQSKEGEKSLVSKVRTN